MMCTEKTPPSTDFRRWLSELTGKESALFISSGSMGNLIPLFINGGRGNEVVTHRESHIMSHEVGSVASIAGVLPQCVDTPKGILTAQAVRPLLRERSYMLSRTTMIEVENTFGGICYPLGHLQEIKALAEEEGPFRAHGRSTLLECGQRDRC